MIRTLISFLALFIVLQSCASTELPDVDNNAPIANAGDDVTAGVGETILLDASPSFDPDGNDLIFRWTLETPDGSTSALSSTNFVETELVPDVAGTYKVELVVSDGALDSPPDIVSIEVTGSSNSRPVAVIDANGPAQIGSPYMLDGIRSSDDDGDVLIFDWLIEGGPEGNNATLTDPIAPNTSFVADMVGEYEISLVVSDGIARSIPTSIFVDVQTSANLPPVADAGANREVAPGSTVELDAGRSADPEGEQLSYIWSMLDRPASSSAELSDASIVNPSFTADSTGIYRLQLVVTDGVLESAPFTLEVEAKQGNLAPLANAGSNLTVAPGEIVALDGTASSDDNGDSMSYAWTFVDRPNTSSAAFSNATAPRPTFIADVPGTYVVQLIVNDGSVNSSPDLMTVNCELNNDAPTAVAGPDQTGTIGQPVTLDGRGSTDPNNNTLTYLWTLTTPASSSSTLSSTTNAMPTFVPDAVGNYVATLVVNDGIVDSSPDVIRVTVGQSVPAAKGDVVLTEIMIDPAATSDNDGEWLEFYNPTNVDWQLQGCVLKDDGSDTHTIGTSLVVPAGTYAVLSRNMAVPNTTYVYSRYSLSNSRDELILECGGTTIVDLDYASTFEVRGKSAELSRNHVDEADNDVAANWCDSVNVFGAGDYGTPGTQNDCSL